MSQNKSLKVSNIAQSKKKNPKQFGPQNVKLFTYIQNLLLEKIKCNQMSVIFSISLHLLHVHTGSIFV